MQTTLDRLSPSENGHAATERKTLKVAIVGKAPASIPLAPWDDESWEIWTLSDAPLKDAKRWTRHFELHDIDGNTAGDPRIRKEKWGKYWDFLKEKHGKPIYLQALNPEVPDGVLFPKREVLREFHPYYTNTVSWLLAYAMHIGTGDDAEFNLTELGLYGVDMAQHGIEGKSEYAHQRPSCEFFLGLAAGKGIRIHIPESSDLLKARRLYAFDSDGGQFAKKMQARRKELNDQQQSLEKKKRELQSQLAAETQRLQTEIQNVNYRQYALAGAIDNLDWVHEWH